MKVLRLVAIVFLVTTITAAANDLYLCLEDTNPGLDSVLVDRLGHLSLWRTSAPVSPAVGCFGLKHPLDRAAEFPAALGPVSFDDSGDGKPLLVVWWTPDAKEQLRILNGAGATMLARLDPFLTVVMGGKMENLASATTEVGHAAVLGWAEVKPVEAVAGGGGELLVACWRERADECVSFLTAEGVHHNRITPELLVVEGVEEELLRRGFSMGLVAGWAAVGSWGALDLSFAEPKYQEADGIRVGPLYWLGMAPPDPLPEAVTALGQHGRVGGSGELAVLELAWWASQPSVLEQFVIDAASASEVSWQGGGFLATLDSSPTGLYLASRLAEEHALRLLLEDQGPGFAVVDGRALRAELPSGVFGSDRKAAELAVAAGEFASADDPEGMLARVLAARYGVGGDDVDVIAKAAGELSFGTVVELPLPRAAEVVAVWWESGPGAPGSRVPEVEVVGLVQRSDGGYYLMEQGASATSLVASVADARKVLLVALGASKVTYQARYVGKAEACAGVPPVFGGLTSAEDREGCRFSGVVLTWPSVDDWNDGEDPNHPDREYRIERSFDGGITWELVATGPDTYGPGHVYTWVDESIPPATKALYRVVAVNADGCSAGEEVTHTVVDLDGTPPEFAGIESAVDVDGCVSTGVKIQWTTPDSWGDLGQGFRTYRVYRRVAGGGEKLVAVLPESQTVYIDTGLGAGEVGEYRVEAVNGCGLVADGAKTLQVTNQDTASPPDFFGAVEAFSPADAGVPRAVIRWCEAASQCGSVVYNIYRSVDATFVPGPDTLLVAGLTGTEYVDTDVSVGTTYYYVVRAEDLDPGHWGPAAGGREDGNLVRLQVSVRSDWVAQRIFADDFDGNAYPRHHVWYKAFFSDDNGDGSFWWWVTDGSNSFMHFGQPDGSAYPAYADDVLILGGYGGDCETNGIELPSMARKITLTYMQRVFLRDTYWGWAFDGAMLMISEDGSNFTQIDKSLISRYPYDYAYWDYCGPSSAPPSRSPVWAGMHPSTGTADQFQWWPVEVDLTKWAGKRIWLAWRVTTDCSRADYGFDVDKVVITAELPASSGEAPPEVSPPGAPQPALIVRDDSSSTGYYLYFQYIPGAFYNVYEGSQEYYGAWTCLRQGVGPSDPDFHVDGSTVRIEITPSSSGSTFYLVTAVGNGVEGTAGRDSFGIERDPANNDCAP